jgi:protein gp37
VSANSSIEWTTHTFNPWWGCEKVSAACKHCYAESFAKRVGQKVWGPDAPRRFFGDAHWAEPLKWNRDAEGLADRPRVFCASMADVFEDREELIPHRARLFDLIEATPNLDWLLLTKRPENMRRFAPDRWQHGWPWNVWAGTTIENNEALRARLTHDFASLPVVVHFLSCEPLLEELDFGPYGSGYLPELGEDWTEADCHSFIDWIIVGAESGHHARRSKPWWFRTIRNECVAAGVAFFLKQFADERGRATSLPKLDGQQWRQIPTPEYTREQWEDSCTKRRERAERMAVQEMPR